MLQTVASLTVVIYDRNLFIAQANCRKYRNITKYLLGLCSHVLQHSLLSRRSFGVFPEWKDPKVLFRPMPSFLLRARFQAKHFHTVESTKKLDRFAAQRKLILVLKRTNFWVAFFRTDAFLTTREEDLESDRRKKK